MGKLSRVLQVLAKKRGYQYKENDGYIVFTHKSAPLKIVIELQRDEALVKLHGENLRDYVEEVYEVEEAPREYLEDLLDELTSVINEITQLLEKQGMKVRTLNTRELVMDVLEIMEEIEEE